MKSRKRRKLAVLTVTIPQQMSDRVAGVHGNEIVNDPAFWQMALRTGIEELERQYRKIEAEYEEEAEDGGYTVIIGSPVLIDPDDEVLPF